MLVEGVLQYLKFVKVLNTYVEHFMLKVTVPAWGTFLRLFSDTKYWNVKLLPIQMIDHLMQRVEKWQKLLTIYGILWWLPFLSPFHNFSCPLLSGYCKFWFVLLHGSTPNRSTYSMLRLSFIYIYEQRNLTEHGYFSFCLSKCRLVDFSQ